MTTTISTSPFFNCYKMGIFGKKASVQYYFILIESRTEFLAKGLVIYSWRTMTTYLKVMHLTLSIFLMFRIDIIIM